MFLWDEEVEEIQISEASIIYKTLKGKQITIRIPACWVQSSNRTEAQDDKRNSEEEEEEQISKLIQTIKREKKDTADVSCLQRPPEYKALESEIEKPRNEIQNFELNPRRNHEHEKDITRLFERQAQYAGEIFTLQQHVTQDIEKGLDEIWSCLDEDDHWKMNIEKYLGIDKGKGIKQNCGQRQNKGGGYKHR